MISQALPHSKLPSILDLGGTKPVDGGESGGEAGGFSALLASLGETTAASDSETGADQASDATPGEVTTQEIGTALPELAATGKTLPPRLDAIAGTVAETAFAATDVTAEISATGPAGEDAAPRMSEATDQGADSEKVAPAAEVPVQAIDVLLAPTLVAAPAPAPAPTTATAVAPGAEGASAQLAAAMVLPAAIRRAPEPAATQPAAADKPAAAPSVTLQVAPLTGGSGEANSKSADADGKAGEGSEKALASERPVARERIGAERAAPEFSPKVAARTIAEAPAVQPAAAPAMPQPVAAVAQPTPAAAIEPASAPSGERPGIENQIARELSRIVDSLSAAREAFSAKSATLALDHADFGELSLRFDQRRDGQLAVQLSAADPEAHRAVAAAVADRPAFGQGDAGAASQQQAQAGANGSARGGATDREGGQSANAARSDRGEQQQRGGGAPNDTDADGQRRSGIFA